MQAFFDDMAFQFRHLSEVERRRWIGEHTVWFREIESRLSNAEKRAVNPNIEEHFRRTRSKTYVHPVTGIVKDQR